VDIEPPRIDARGTEAALGFGALLRQYRLASGLTQEALAEQAGLSPRSIQHLERGETRPYRDTVRRLVQALGLAGEQRARLEAVAPAAPRRTTPSEARQPSASALISAARGPVQAPTEPVPPAPHNLPVQLTSFVGRDTALRALQDLLITDSTSPHLITLTGAGGSGKTRLALEVAAILLQRPIFTDGIFYVGLGSLSDPELVIPAAARTLGLAEMAGRTPLAALVDHVRARRLLLVLDNMEHLRGATPGIAALLESCPHLRVLATSRVPLHIYGERDVPVPPLPAPDPGRLPALEQLAAYDAVRLFVARARDVAADFALTRHNAAAVAAICAQLEGLPLALELAASRCKVLSPQAIMARLDRRLPLLVNAAPTLPARHRTLRAAIAWSYDLLGAQEQALFRRLAIFAGGCSLSAVEALGRGSHLLPSLELETLEGVTILVDHSLLHPDPACQDDAEPRFLMLETVREYALEQLVAAGEREALQQQHADYYGAIAGEAAPHLADGGATGWLERLEREHDNLRTALAWLLAQGEADQSLRLAIALTPFWSAQGHFGEGRTWVAAVVSLPGSASHPTERAILLEQAADFAHRQRDLAPARSLLEESLALWRAVGDRRGIARAQCALADAIFNLGDPGTARVLFEESLALWRELGEKRELARTLYLFAFLPLCEEDRATARALAEESLHLARAVDDRALTAGGLAFLGWMSLEDGATDAARALYTESQALRQEVGDRWFINLHRVNLAQLAIVEGEYAAARDLLAESLPFWRDAGVIGEIPALALRTCAWLAAAQGQGTRALRLLAAVGTLGVMTPGHDDLWPAFATALERACRDLGAEEQSVAQAEGRALSLEEAIAYALDDRWPF
jgi:non-specific serine/threonine protein kinase